MPKSARTTHSEPTVESTRHPSPQPELSDPRLDEDAYTIRLRLQGTFAKTAAVERTYRVKVGENVLNKRLTEICRDLHRVFNENTRQTRGDLADNDLIHHSALQNPIVVHLQRLENLTSV